MSIAQVSNWVGEYTTTSGSGNINFSGAIAGFAPTAS